MPHHLLHTREIRVVEQGKGGGGVAQTVDHNARLLYASQELILRDDPMNGTRRERLTFR